MGRAVAEMRGAFEEWLQRRDRYYMTDTGHREMKRAVQVAKRMAERQWRERLGNDFDGNKMMFWKQVKRVRKG